jgi:hypothetical protein
MDSSNPTTDLVLLRCTLGDAGGLAAAAALWCAASPQPMELQRAAWSADKQLAHVYARPLQPLCMGDGDRDALAALWLRTCPASSHVEVCRLATLFDAPGASRGEAALFHYIVETDAEQGWMDEIGRWYDIEHMPGLAAVPGCIHARRLANPDGGPWSFACYDLTREETLGSPPWLAVRGTAWSDRARPHFTNTRRTMMRVVA